MKFSTVVLTWPCLGRPMKLVLSGMRPPVESGSERVVPSWWIWRRVTPRLHNIELSASRPIAILIVGWKHPNCRPQPISTGQLRSHFHFSVREREAFGGPDACRLHWVEDVSSTSCTTFATEKRIACALISGLGTPYVQGKTATNCSFADFILRQCRTNVQNAVLHETIAAIVGVVLKLPIPTAS